MEKYKYTAPEAYWKGTLLEYYTVLSVKFTVYPLKNIGNTMKVPLETGKNEKK